jgi:hypothetical protein
MKYVISLVFLLLVACEDRYRYHCQNPKHFQEKRCQRPDCLFSQDCPDYLVAPILEKQIERPTVNPNDPPTQNAASSTNR